MLHYIKLWINPANNTSQTFKFHTRKKSAYAAFVYSIWFCEQSCEDTIGVKLPYTNQIYTKLHNR